MRKSLMALAIAIAVMVPSLLTMGGTSSGGQNSGWASGGVIFASGQTVLPNETLTDWVTYGDRAVVMTVTDESRGELTPEERERGEGHTLRTVDLQREKTLWTRDGSSQNPPTGLTVAAGGWIVHGTDERELRMEGSSSFTVGTSYLVLLTYGDPTSGVDPTTREYMEGSEGPSWGVLDAVHLAENVVTLDSDVRHTSVWKQ